MMFQVILAMFACLKRSHVKSRQTLVAADGACSQRPGDHFAALVEPVPCIVLILLTIRGFLAAGGAWGAAVDEDPFAQAEKVTSSEASIFNQAEGYRGAAIDFESYERPKVHLLSSLLHCLAPCSALLSTPASVVANLGSNSELRVALRVQANVSGRNAPKPIESFEEANLDDRVNANVIRCKYRCEPPPKRPTEHWLTYHQGPPAVQALRNCINWQPAQEGSAGGQLPCTRTLVVRGLHAHPLSEGAMR